MIQRLGRLIAGLVLCWLLLAIPAKWLWGPDMMGQSLAAMLLCLAPAAVTLLWEQKALGKPADQQVMALLGSVGVRMAVVLAGGFVLYFLVPGFKATSFWLWLAAFYLLTLGLEMTLLLTGGGPEQADGQ